MTRYQIERREQQRQRLVEEAHKASRKRVLEAEERLIKRLGGRKKDFTFGKYKTGECK